MARRGLFDGALIELGQVPLVAPPPAGPTRLYLRSTDAALGTFDTTTIGAERFSAGYVPVVRSMGPTKSGTSMSDVTQTGIADGDQALMAIFVSPPLAAGVTFGDTISVVVGATRTGGSNAFAAGEAWLLNPDGTIKAVIRSASLDPSFAGIGTTRTAYAFITNTTFASAAAAGDRIAIGIGIEAFLAGCDATLRIGDAAATDISAAGDTDDDAPWVDFGEVLTFEAEAGGPTAVDLLLDGSATTVTTSSINVDAAASVEVDGSATTVTASTINVDAAAAVEVEGSLTTVATSSINTDAAAAVEVEGSATTVTASTANIDAAADLEVDGSTTTVVTSSITLQTGANIDLALDGSATTVTTSSIALDAAAAVEVDGSATTVTTSVVNVDAAAAVEADGSLTTVTTSAAALDGAAALEADGSLTTAATSTIDLSLSAGLDLLIEGSVTTVTTSAVALDAAATLQLEPSATTVTTGAVDVDATALLELEPSTTTVTTSAVRILLVSTALLPTEVLAAAPRRVSLAAPARRTQLQASTRASTLLSSTPTAARRAAPRRTTLEARP
jgi:hypothetical protein